MIQEQLPRCKIKWKEKILADCVDLQSDMSSLFSNEKIFVPKQ